MASKVRHIIAMQNDNNEPHPWTGSTTVYLGPKNAVVAYAEWAEPFHTPAEAHKAIRKLPERVGGYTVVRVAR